MRLAGMNPDLSQMMRAMLKHRELALLGNALREAIESLSQRILVETLLAHMKNS